MEWQVVASAGAIEKFLPVQHPPHLPPFGHELRHEPIEPLVMILLDKMQQFMQQDVVQTDFRMVDELQIDPDSSRLDVAGAPACLHVFCPPFVGVEAGEVFDDGEAAGDGFFEFAAQDFAQEGGATGGVGAGADAEVDARAVV